MNIVGDKMIICTNGIETFSVTEGAFDSFFKDQGFVKVEVENKITKVDNEDDVIDDVIEKPISEWTKQEVKDFAAKNEIDISGTKNVNQAKEIIKRYLENI